VHADAEFSVYNAVSTKRSGSDNPLASLVPPSRDHGWHVARNLRKPLNHLDFLGTKEQIAARLQLHNVLTPAHRYDLNYELLALHQARRVSTEAVIAHLRAQLASDGAPLDEAEIRQLLREYATVRHMEFHPTDVCNLRCRGCTYGHDRPDLKPPPIHYPFGGIGLIRSLRPQSMVIIGGGEPTLFAAPGGIRFQQLVEEIIATNPGIRLALVTNGTHKPTGDWPRHFSWIRLSLDAAAPDTYTAFRGKPMFDRVIRNFLAYLEHDVDQVGISFLYARSNIHDYAEVSRLVFDLVNSHRPDALHRVNIQYRPLRQDPYLYEETFTEAVTSEQVDRAVEEVRALASADPALEAFLRDQTNVTAVLGGNSHPPHPFARCYYSEAFRIVRANGDLRPCFIRVVEPDFILGNILRDPPEAIALNTLMVAGRRKPHCDPHGCRQCHVNYTFEQGLNGTMAPSTSVAVRADPMF